MIAEQKRIRMWNFKIIIRSIALSKSLLKHCLISWRITLINSILNINGSNLLETLSQMLNRSKLWFYIMWKYSESFFKVLLFTNCESINFLSIMTRKIYSYIFITLIDNKRYCIQCHDRKRIHAFYF